MLIRSRSGPILSRIKLGQIDMHEFDLGPVQSVSDTSWDGSTGMDPVSDRFDFDSSWDGSIGISPVSI